MFERLDSRFDVLTQVLEAVHLGSALSARIEVRSPWSLHFGELETRLAGFHVVVEGRGWVHVDGSDEPVAVEAGDIVVFPHGHGHILTDARGGETIEIGAVVAGIAPGQCVALPCGDQGEPTVLLCGSYSFGRDGTNPLLAGLPRLLHVRADEIDGPLAAVIQLLASEAGAAGSGSAMVVDRLVSLLFIYALRQWLLQNRQAGGCTWFGALQHPVIGPAVRAVHENPAHGWTVDALARHAGLSRAAFARRFQQAVGEAPLAYVTRWRMTLATDLLERGERIAKVAHQVGYENEFAFAKAFKRVRGIAPGQLRRKAA